MRLLMMFIDGLRATAVAMTGLTLLVVRVVAGDVRCTDVQTNCVARVGCGMALHNYMLGCQHVINGDSNVCPDRCLKALVSLISTEDQEGKAFLECDCNGNDFCVRQRTRLEVCSQEVRDILEILEDENANISCSLAEMLCRADASCQTAIHYFKMHCARLESGDKCTSRCKNSLDILLRQKRARKLRTCYCDNTESYQCQVVQESIERLCYPNNSYSHASSRTTDVTTHTNAGPAEVGCSSTNRNSCTSRASSLSASLAGIHLLRTLFLVTILHWVGNVR